MQAEVSALLGATFVINLLFFLFMADLIRSVYKRLNYKVIDSVYPKDDIDWKTMKEKLSYYGFVMFFNALAFLYPFPVSFSGFIVFCIVGVIQSVLLGIVIVFQNRLERRPR